MTTQTTNKTETKPELLLVLTKGMITIPKKWRVNLGFKKGDRLRAVKKDYQIILEPLEKEVPYRVYSQKELNQFIKDDVLPKNLKQKIQKKLQNA